MPSPSSSPSSCPARRGAGARARRIWPSTTGATTPPTWRSAGLDSDGNVAVIVEPPAVTTDPGTATFADVTVKPKKRFWRGPSKTLPFQVVASRDGEEDAEPLVVDGTMVQEAVVPKWLLRALLLLLLLCLLAIPAWFLLLKPSVESTAKDAAAEEVEQQLAEPKKQAAAGGGGGGG